MAYTDFLFSAIILITVVACGLCTWLTMKIYSREGARG